MFVDDSFNGSVDSSLIRTDEFGLEPYFSDIYGYLRSTEVSLLMNLSVIFFPGDNMPIVLLDNFVSMLPLFVSSYGLVIFTRI